MTPRVYIVGDVHYPTSGAVFLDFLDALAALPPARLAVLGDLFDHWLDTAACASAMMPVAGRMRRLKRLGWSIDLVLGNRELAAGRRLEAACGLRMHWPSLIVAAGPRRARLVHGDRLCRDPGYHLYTALLRGFWFRPVLRCGPGFMQGWIAAMVRRISRRRSLRRRRGGMTGASLSLLDPRRIRAAGRGVSAVLAGHVHSARHLRASGLDFILAGDWLGRRGHWLEIGPDGRIDQRVWPRDASMTTQDHRSTDR